MWEHDCEGESVACPLSCSTFPLHVLRGRYKVVFVVGDIGASPDPAREPKLGLSGRIQQWLHAKVELAVGLLTVDDVESVLCLPLHVGNLHMQGRIVTVCLLSTRFSTTTVFCWGSSLRKCETNLASLHTTIYATNSLEDNHRGIHGIACY